MGLLSASSSFTRYRIIEEVPASLYREVPERLLRNAFRDIDDTADERSFGWVSFENWLNPSWREAPPEKADFFAFTMRLDTRRVAPAVFKKHFQLAIDAYKESLEEGKRFVSKDRKKELKEQTRLKLMARALPVPAVFDAAWNRRTNRLWLATTNTKVRGLFEDLFTLTFDLHLEPLNPFFLGVSLLGEKAWDDLSEVDAAEFA